MKKKWGKVCPRESQSQSLSVTADQDWSFLNGGGTEVGTTQLS